MITLQEAQLAYKRKYNEYYPKAYKNYEREINEAVQSAIDNLVGYAYVYYSLDVECAAIQDLAKTMGFKTDTCINNGKWAQKISGWSSKNYC